VNWFDIVTGGELEQGDILFDVPLYEPDPAAWTNGVFAKIPSATVIVMSQSCDIAYGQKPHITNVWVCGVQTLEELRLEDSAFGSRDFLEQVRRRLSPDYFMLNEQAGAPSIPMCLVLYRRACVIPRTWAEQHAESAGERLRLKSPMREDLALGFGHMFSRVAMPTGGEIPPFKAENYVAKATAAYKQMGEEEKSAFHTSRGYHAKKDGWLGE
jgi:hypothetical protein